MKEMPIDSSLAFTAQMEVRPGLTSKEGDAWRGALLAAWYAQEAELNMWNFARQYAAAEDEITEGAKAAGLPVHTAVITRTASGWPAPRAVAAYMPRRYRVCGVTEESITIMGFDYDGWTMDDYVLPRLGSGMIFARETTQA